MNNSARVIVTLKCSLSCKNCANNNKELIKSAREITSPQELEGYDDIVITGGEPLSVPHIVEDIVNHLHSPDRTIYLYTSGFSEKGALIYHKLDGITLTIHKEVIMPIWRSVLTAWESTIEEEKLEDVNNRLFIDSRLMNKLTFKPGVWDEVKLIRMLNPELCSIPENEDFFIFKENGNVFNCS